MKILVTGNEGYLGSVLTPVLLEHGHEVIGIDTGFYESGCLYQDPTARRHTLHKDIREVVAEDLKGVDAVVHMAELSNDPACELAPKITYEINHRGSVRLARMAKECGIGRFVYMSSCSVYGLATTGYASERSPLNPQTAYAICKAMVERDIGQLADDNFSPTFLRNATAFGASPRMRFDIVLNNLSGLAWTTKEIRMVSDGTPWRPLVHALDIAQAINLTLGAPREAIHKEIFNVGETSHNYTIREIAEVVADVFPGCRLTFGKEDADQRSYRVAFDRIKEKLPAFVCRWNARRGAEQLRELFGRIDLTAETFHGRFFTRLAGLRYLVQTRQIDESFYWRDRFASSGRATSN